MSEDDERLKNLLLIHAPVTDEEAASAAPFIFVVFIVILVLIFAFKGCDEKKKKPTPKPQMIECLLFKESPYGRL